jgi:hypothetical protein
MFYIKVSKDLKGIIYNYLTISIEKTRELQKCNNNRVKLILHYLKELEVINNPNLITLTDREIND